MAAQSPPAAPRGGWPEDRLSWSLDESMPEVVLRLSGILDLATAPTMRFALETTLAIQPAGLIVDVSDLRVGDEIQLTGLTSVAKRAAAWPGCPMALSGPSQALSAALHRMGVDRYVAVCDTLAQARRWVVGEAVGRRYREHLLPAPAAISVGRRLTARICELWGLTNFSAPAQLIVTELLSNSVRHAGTPMELSLIHVRPYLRVAVRDGSTELPRRTDADAEGVSGRGLIIVEAFSSSWSSNLTPDGKVVWAVIAGRRR
jgi:anti-anti-sigma regulatory factor/anti-sigma regulatory factor (Ser/Thr protein kinase)